MYAKVFTSIFSGSMQGKSDLILVFINLLCHSNKDGIVDIHWRNIAFETGLGEERTKAALTELESPDPDSRRRNDEGRRIVRLDPERTWGWEIVNYTHYSEMITREHRRKYMKDLMREKRKLTNANVSKSLANVYTDTDTSISLSSSFLQEGDVGGYDRNLPVTDSNATVTHRNTQALRSVTEDEIQDVTDGHDMSRDNFATSVTSSDSMSKMSKMSKTCQRQSKTSNTKPVGQDVTIEDCIIAAEGLCMPKEQIEHFWAHFAAVGFINASGLPITNLKAALNKWKLNQPSHGKKYQESSATLPAKVATPVVMRWDDAVVSVVDRLWSVRNNSDEFKRQMSVARDKYKDMGSNREGQSVLEEAMDIIDTRRKTGWGK